MPIALLPPGFLPPHHHIVILVIQRLTTKLAKRPIRIKRTFSWMNQWVSEWMNFDFHNSYTTIAIRRGIWRGHSGSQPTRACKTRFTIKAKCADSTKKRKIQTKLGKRGLGIAGRNHRSQTTNNFWRRIEEIEWSGVAEWRSSMVPRLKSEARRSLEFLDPTRRDSIHKWPCQAGFGNVLFAGWLISTGWEWDMGYGMAMDGNGARDAIVEVCQLAVGCCSWRGGHRRMGDGDSGLGCCMRMRSR